MTEIENKYKNGKIYKITSNQTEKWYIGSSTQKLYDRIANHRANYKLWQNNPDKYDFVTSYDIIKYDDHKIELIEEYPCNTKQELRQRENYYLALYKNICVNKIRAYQSKEEKKLYN